MKKWIAIGLILAAQVALPAAAKDVAVPVAGASHFVALEGVHNFRDVGGYRTEGGRVVRRGVFYRSAALSGLTAGGMQQFSALKVGAIIDLRSTAERRTDTSNWLAVSGQGYWARDYALDMTGFSALFGDPATLTPERVRAAMAEGYRTTPKALAPAYRELFARLVAGRGAVVVNCTAGKDRTGIATALVLTALGVPYETVREDFLLSNAATRSSSSADRAGFAGMAALPHAVLAPLAGVEGPYLDAAFDQIRQDYGSVEGYLQRELGIGPRELAALRRRMLI